MRPQSPLPKVIVETRKLAAERSLLWRAAGSSLISRKPVQRAELPRQIARTGKAAA